MTGFWCRWVYGPQRCHISCMAVSRDLLEFQHPVPELDAERIHHVPHISDADALSIESRSTRRVHANLHSHRVHRRHHHPRYHRHHQLEQRKLWTTCTVNCDMHAIGSE